MTERPILFSGEMIRALLAGRKTQTRRPVKQRPVLDSYNEIGSWDGPGEEDEYTLSLCPYGKPGDTLWVREAWGIGGSGYLVDPTLNYRADGAQRPLDPDLNHMRPEVAKVFAKGWRPSIHMPRWASRITLQVTDVRVERVQDISEEDARAEGVIEEPVYCAKHGRLACSFAILWDSIHKEGSGFSWDQNPWVWVVKFEVRP